MITTTRTAVLDALRRLNGPATAEQITTAIYGGCSETDGRKRAARQWQDHWTRVWLALNELYRDGDVMRLEAGADELWELTDAAEETDPEYTEHIDTLLTGISALWPEEDQ